MAKNTKANERKELVFQIQYCVHPEDAGSIGEIMDKMRETGTAEILDVYVQPYKEMT